MKFHNPLLFFAELLLLLVVWAYIFYANLSKDLEAPWFFGVIILVIMLLDTWISLFGFIDINFSLVILIPSLLIAGKDQHSDFGVGTSVTFAHIMIGMFLGIIFGVLSSIFAYASVRFSLITFSALIMVLQTSIIEELVFRGLLLGYMRRAGMNFFVANSIQAAIFLGGHLDMNSIKWKSIFLVVVFAWVAGLLTAKTRSVKVPIIMHFVANLMSM